MPNNSDSKPLSSTESCKFPFRYNDRDNYFCQVSNTNYVCETQSGEIKSCNRGNSFFFIIDWMQLNAIINYCKGSFLRFLSAAAGTAFSTSFYIYSIKLPVESLYKLALYTFIHCASTVCNNANDYIAISISDTPGSSYKEIYRIDYSKGRIRDEKWILDEMYYNATSPKTLDVG